MENVFNETVNGISGKVTAPKVFLGSHYRKWMATLEDIDKGKKPPFYEREWLGMLSVCDIEIEGYTTDDAPYHFMVAAIKWWLIYLQPVIDPKA